MNSEYGLPIHQWFAFSKRHTTHLFRNRPGRYLILVIVAYPQTFRLEGYCRTASGGPVGGQVSHISENAGRIFSIRSSMELSGPVIAQRHGYLSICPTWICPWAKDLSNLETAGPRLCETTGRIFSVLSTMELSRPRCSRAKSWSFAHLSHTGLPMGQKHGPNKGPMRNCYRFQPVHWPSNEMPSLWPRWADGCCRSLNALYYKRELGESMYLCSHSNCMTLYIDVERKSIFKFPFKMSWRHCMGWLNVVLSDRVFTLNELAFAWTCFTLWKPSLKRFKAEVCMSTCIQQRNLHSKCLPLSKY